MRKLAFAAGLAAATALTLPGPATAAVTSTTVTTPANNTVVDPGDLGVADGAFTVSGTTNADVVAGDKVDIVCAYASPVELVDPPLAEDVPVDPGTHAFSANATVDLNSTSYSRCRVIAIPAGTTPVSYAPFTGPVVAIDGWARFPVAFVGNAGKLADYAQYVSAPQGYFSLGSATKCAMGDSFLTDPVTLDFTPFFGCAGIELDLPADAQFKVDGIPAYLPAGAASINQTLPGLLGIEDFAHQSDPSTGDAGITGVEPVVLCSNGGGNSCPSGYTDAQLHVEHSATTSAEGRLLVVRDRFVNTAATARDVSVQYRVQFQAGVSFGPVPTRRTGPGILSAVSSTGTEGTFTKPHGAIGWSGPGGITTSGSLVFLSYWRLIPPGGSTTIAHSYAQATTMATADQLALGAVSGGTPSISITSPEEGETLTRPATFGRVTTPVTVSGTVADNEAIAGLTLRPIDGATVKATISGANWTAQVPAAAGANTYIARVVDDEGNAAEATRSFTFVPQFTSEPPRRIPPVIRFTLSLKKPKAGATSVSVTSTLTAPGVVVAKLAARVRSGKKTKVVTVGTLTKSLTKTGKTTFSVPLNATGKALLARLKTLKTTLTAIYRPTVSSKTTTRSDTFTFKAKLKKKTRK